MHARRRDIVLVLAIFAVRLALCALGGTGVGDESWFLRVVERVANGETLYRDVFFGSTPLAAQIAVAAARIGGAEAIVVKAVWAAASAATVLVCVRVARRFGMTAPAPLVALPFVVYPPPGSEQLYGTMALLFQLVALDAVLAAGDAPDGSPARRTVAVAAAGAAAGLAFATKPNVGAFTAVAVGVASALLTPSGGAAAWVRRMTVAAAAFVVAAAVPAIPVAAGGAWPAFADHVFINKVTYLRVAGESYFGQVAARVPWRATSAADAVSRVLNLPVLFAYPAAAAALAVAWRHAAGRDRRRLAALAVFVAAAAAFIYPRANFRHLSHSMAAAVLALCVAWHALAPAMRPAVRRAARATAIAWLGLSAAWLAGLPIASLADGTARFSDLPHYRGVVMDSRTVASAHAVAETFAAEARAGGRPFVVGREAGFLGLVSGVPNPTPIDYPYSPSMGRTGEADTIAAIAGGRIGVVFLDPRTPPELAPKALESYVRTHLRRDGSAGPYEVWRPSR